MARSAGVARSWIYTQPDLLDRINAQPSSTRATGNPRTIASEESWQRRIELAHQRIKELTEENHQLGTQLTIAHGQRRARVDDTVRNANPLIRMDKYAGNPRERMFERWRDSAEYPTLFRLHPDAEH